MYYKNKEKVFKLEGMSCISCENKIKTILRIHFNIERVKVSFEKGTIEFNTDSKTNKKIYSFLLREGYVLGDEIGYIENKSIFNKDNLYVLLTLLVILIIYLVIKNTIGFNNIPEVTDNMSYMMLFVVGLLTSLHCIAMCGGINLSQSISKNFNIKPSIMYNIGRILSYTIIGVL